MTVSIRLLLAHPPMAKPRPRATLQGRVYMPDRYRAWQEAVLLDACRQYRGEALQGPIEMSLVVWGPRRGLGDLEGYFGALADTLGGHRRAKRPGLCFDDDDQILSLHASMAPAREWLLDVGIRQIPAIDYPKRRP